MKNSKLQEFRQTIHTFMHSISPNCKYMVVLSDPEDEDTLNVASSFNRDDTKEILVELLISLEEGSAIEQSAKVIRPGSSLN